MRRRSRTPVCAFAALVALPLSALAGGGADQPADAYSRSGFYLGASAAYAKPRFSKKDIYQYYWWDWDYDDDELDVEVGDGWGWSATAGYRLFPWFAIEAQYERVRDIEMKALIGEDRTLRIQALTTNLKFILPSGNLQPFVMGGFGAVKYDTKEELGSREPYRRLSWALAGRVGGGVDLYVTEHILIHGAVSIVMTDGDLNPHRGIGGTKIEKPHYLSVNTGLQYRF